jgi:hypothetical protein
MDNSRLPLLCRSPLQPNESLPSLLIRLSKENGYHSPTMVARICRERSACHDRITQPTQSQTYEVLADLVRIEVEELYAASVHRFAPVIVPPSLKRQTIVLPSGQTVRLQNYYFLREHTWPESDAQFCPLCLQDSAYHRLGWIPLAVSVCLTHHCLLVRGCPQCGQNLKISDILDTECPSCSLDLAEAPVVDVSADRTGLLSQMTIQSWLGLCSLTEAERGCLLPNQPPSVLYRFLDGLRKSIMGVRRSWDYLHKPSDSVPSRLFPCTSKSDITPAKSYILYTTAFKGVANWPNGFYGFLDAYKLRDERGCLQTAR